MTASRSISAVLLVAALFAVSACGRKGDLETPYSAAVEAREEAERQNQPVPPEPQKPAEDRPFILDGLI